MTKLKIRQQFGRRFIFNLLSTVFSLHLIFYRGVLPLIAVQTLVILPPASAVKTPASSGEVMFKSGSRRKYFSVISRSLGP